MAGMKSIFLFLAPFVASRWINGKWLVRLSLPGYLCRRGVWQKKENDEVCTVFRNPHRVDGRGGGRFPAGGSVFRPASAFSGGSLAAHGPSRADGRPTRGVLFRAAPAVRPSARRAGQRIFPGGVASASRDTLWANLYVRAARRTSGTSPGFPGRWPRLSPQSAGPRGPLPPGGGGRRIPDRLCRRNGRQSVPLGPGSAFVGAVKGFSGRRSAPWVRWSFVMRKGIWILFLF